MSSVSPTFCGFTPIGIVTAAASATLIVAGVTRVGICELESTGINQCTEAWNGLADNAKAATLGVTGLLAQSPLAELLRRKDEELPPEPPAPVVMVETIPPPEPLPIPLGEMMDGGTLPEPADVEVVAPPTNLPQRRRVTRKPK